jgi:hypothetical protein
MYHVGKFTSHVVFQHLVIDVTDQIAFLILHNESHRTSAPAVGIQEISVVSAMFLVVGIKRHQGAGF